MRSNAKQKWPLNQVASKRLPYSFVKNEYEGWKSKPKKKGEGNKRRRNIYTKLKLVVKNLEARSKSITTRVDRLKEAFHIAVDATGVSG